MSIQSLERMIRDQAAEELQHPKLRIKDLLAWQTAPIEPLDGEIVIHLAGLGVWVAVLAACDHRPTDQT